MRKNESMTVLAAALALCLAGAGAAQAAKPDAWITAKVKSALAAHKNVSAIHTDVDTDNGVVTLKGTAKSTAEKELAARYARKVEGVRSVNNEIVVKGDGYRTDADDRVEGSGDRAVDRVEGSGDRGMDTTEHAADRAGNRAEGAGDRAVNYMGDAALTGKVKSALAAHRGTSAIHTDVDTERGHVTLSGTAASSAERDLAEKVVRDVKGVKSVDNDIKVR